MPKELNLSNPYCWLSMDCTRECPHRLSFDRAVDVFDDDRLLAYANYSSECPTAARLAKRYAGMSDIRWMHIEEIEAESRRRRRARKKAEKLEMSGSLF